MELKGIVHLIGQTETLGNNGFTKRQLVIATEEQYVQYVPIDFVKDKTTILDNYKIGENVTVYINVRGSEYNGKYYVNLQGWKIEKKNTEQMPPTPNDIPVNGAQNLSPQPSFEPATNLNDEEQSDLPF